MQKCNYQATLEGLIISHHAMNFLHEHDGAGFLGLVAQLLLVNEMLANALDDAMTLAVTMIGFNQHKDPWAFGVLLGKGAKFFAQLYLEGLVWKESNDLDF